jgi:hypothetical protein
MSFRGTFTCAREEVVGLYSHNAWDAATVYLFTAPHILWLRVTHIAAAQISGDTGRTADSINQMDITSQQ